MITMEWPAWSCTVGVTTLRAADLTAVVGVVREVMGEVGRAADRFRPDSDLSRINSASGRSVGVTALTLDLLELAIATAVRTSGAVTPTTGADLIAVGYDATIEIVRSREVDRDAGDGSFCPAPGVGAANRALSLVRGGTKRTVRRRVPPPAAEAIHLDRPGGRVSLTPGTRLDLGAIAKAYAVDEALRRVAARGLGGALVSIGGDLAVHGSPDDGWLIAVSETGDDEAVYITIDSGAVTTSSTMGRRWGANHHIIDPRTGRSSTGDWRTATVLAPTAVEANVFSTWALVDPGGAAAAMREAARPARVVTTAGLIETIGAWPAADKETIC